MNQQEIVERVLETVRDVVETGEVTADSSLMDDLDMESIEVFSLLGRLEREFHVRIPERSLSQVDTVRDLADVVGKAAGGKL